MPHSPMTREVEFSGVDEEKRKIATGSGKSTGTENPATTNATSHDSWAQLVNNPVSDGIIPATHSASPLILGTPNKGNFRTAPKENGDAYQNPQHNAKIESSFSSPDRNRMSSSQAAKAGSDSIKLDKEVAHLKEQLADATPKALQKVLRDKWREFLFEGTGIHHLSFVIRALLKNANSEVLDHVGDELIFKGGLFDAAISSDRVIDAVLKNVEVGELLESVPTKTVDKMVQSRIKTVPAKTLIKWLAEGDRLGYQLDDIIEDGESVMPNVPVQASPDVEMTNGIHNGPQDQSQNGSRGTPQHEYQQNGFTNQRPPMNNPIDLPNDPVLANKQRERHAEALRLASLENYQMSSGPPSASSEKMQCPSCHYWFYDVSGFNYHVNKKVCHKEPNGYKFSCTRCYQGFSTKQGQEYHCKKEVCASNDTPPARESPSGQLQREATYALPPMHGLPGPHPTAAPPVQPPQHAHPGPGPVLQSQTGAYSSQPPVAIPRPPLNTPTSARRELSTPDIRHSPSELPPEKLAQLNQELADEDNRYARLVAQANALHEDERANKLVSLKNGTASKKSQIRKRFGVSLRLRDKDKAARVAAGATATPAPNPPRMKSTTHMSSPLPSRTASVIIPSSTGFSPINAAQRSGPSPPNEHPYGSPSPYPPPQRPSIAPQNGSLRHAQADQPSGSGFGVLINDKNSPRYAPQNQMTMSTYADQQRNGKRRRSEDDEEGRHDDGDGRHTFRAYSNSVPRTSMPTQRPKMSMMELSAEDAASKYPKKVLAPGQARNYSLPSSRSPVENTFSSTAPAKASRSAGRDQATPTTEPTYISSDDESKAAPRPSTSHDVLPSIEGGASRKGSEENAHGKPNGSVRRGDTTEDEGSLATRVEATDKAATATESGVASAAQESG